MIIGLNRIAKRLIPLSLHRILTSMFYGWHGNYHSWAEASAKCTGYSSDNIINAVIKASLKVRDGYKVYERDSVTYDKVQYSLSLLTGLLLSSVLNKGRLKVLDFGGALGSSYFQNQKFLKCTDEVDWCIVEQEKIVNAGKEHFESSDLHFFNTIEECKDEYYPNTVVLSSVLQYLENPFSVLEEIISLKPACIIIDRTPFIKGKKRITIQKVHPAIYRAKYPCWFFNEEEFISSLKSSYRMVEEFEALDKANIPSVFKGFIFIKNDD